MGFCINNHYKFGQWIKSILIVIWMTTETKYLMHFKLKDNFYCITHNNTFWFCDQFFKWLFFYYVYNYLFIKLLCSCKWHQDVMWHHDFVTKRFFWIYINIIEWFKINYSKIPFTFAINSDSISNDDVAYHMSTRCYN